MNEDERLALPAGEFGEGLCDPTLERGISGAGGRNGLLFVPNGAPALPNRTPAPMFVRLIDEDSVEPGFEAGILPEPAQCPIRFDEGILGDVLGGVLIAANQTPGQAASLVVVGRHDVAEPLFQIQRRCGELQCCGPCHDRTPLGVPQFRPLLGGSWVTCANRARESAAVGNYFARSALDARA